MVPTKRRRPDGIAIIDPDCCTGCRACMEVCPTDCIEDVALSTLGLSGPGRACEVRVADCLGCGQCARLCPWDAIHLVDANRAEQAYGLEAGSL